MGSRKDKHISLEGQKQTDRIKTKYRETLSHTNAWGEILSAHNQYWVCLTFAMYLHKSPTSTPSSLEHKKKSIPGYTDNYSDHSNTDIIPAFRGKDNLNCCSHPPQNYCGIAAATQNMGWYVFWNKMKLIQASTPSVLRVHYSPWNILSPRDLCV